MLRGLFSKVVTASLLASCMFAFQNCGGTQEVKHTGGMTTDTQIGFSSSMTDEIGELFSKLFKRDPSSAERKKYTDLLASGASMAQIRTELARSSEALEPLKAALLAKFGSTASLEIFVQMLELGSGLEDVLKLLK